MKTLLLAAILLGPGAAAAHLNGAPTTAWPTAPAGVGEVVDASFEFGWTDYDEAASTENTSIDWYYTARMPPTFRMGTHPAALEGEPIVKGVLESDLANAYVWDASAVPAGTYFLFSIAHDPPFEMIAFSRGAVTVAHEGDELSPAVIVAEPDGAQDVADAFFEVGYEAFDPDGTGRVTLEATTSNDGTGLLPIAEDLPAEAAGSFRWDTSALPEGDWTIKATIVDGRGLRSEAFGRFYLRIDHQAAGTGGSGGAGASGGGGGGGDGGSTGSGGSAGAAGGSSGDDGCAAGGSGLGVLALLLPWGLRRRGR